MEANSYERLVKGYDGFNSVLRNGTKREEPKIAGSLKIRYISDSGEREAEIISQNGELVEIRDIKTNEVFIVHENYIKREEKTATQKRHAEKRVCKNNQSCRNYSSCGQTTGHKTGICKECRTIKCQYAGCEKVVMAFSIKRYCANHTPERMNRL